MSTFDLQQFAAEIYKSQRSDQAMRYERLRKGFAALRASHNPEHKKELKRLRDEFLEQKAVAGSQVHSNAFLSNMSVQYANDAFIGERLCGVVPVGQRSNDFAVYPRRERFEFPDDSMGARSHANEIGETRVSDNYSVKDYGLSNFVSQDTLDNQDAVFDEMVDLVEACNEGIAYKRELRVASALTTASNYSGNTTTLSGSDQWDSAAGGDPIQDIQTGIAALFNGFGATRLVGFCSLSGFLSLARHPLLLDLFKYNKQGLLKREDIASYLGLDEILVSAARKQTANEGQTASYSRIWGNDFGIVRVSARPTKRSAHFASIFRMNGDPVTTQWDDPAIGTKGGHYAKVTTREDIKIVAAPTGYLIKSAVATAV
jgi:hypothetical protein